MVEKATTIEEFASGLISHLADWALTEAPMHATTVKDEERQELIYSTIQECIEVVEEHLKKDRQKKKVAVDITSIYALKKALSIDAPKNGYDRGVNEGIKRMMLGAEIISDDIDNVYSMRDICNKVMNDRNKKLSGESASGILEKKKAVE